MVNVVNSISPKKTVKNIVDTRHSSAGGRLIIDFKAFPKWTHSIRCDDFTNEFSSAEECSENLFKLINKLFPYLQEEHKNIFNGAGHCHTIVDSTKKRKKKAKVNKPRTKVSKIVKQLHGTDLDPSAEVWQLSYGEGIRLIGVLLSNDKDVILYPLFIDQHHIIYPSDNHNQTDMSSASYSFRPQECYY